MCFNADQHKTDSLQHIADGELVQLEHVSEVVILAVDHAGIPRVVHAAWTDVLLKVVTYLEWRIYVIIPAKWTFVLLHSLHESTQYV